MGKSQLEQLANLADDEIDFSDIKELKTLKSFKRLYPHHKSSDQIQIFAALDDELHKVIPEKKPVTINLDKRVIDFFKQHSKKYQTKINDILVAFVNNYQAKH